MGETKDKQVDTQLQIVVHAVKEKVGSSDKPRGPLWDNIQAIAREIRSTQSFPGSRNSRNVLKGFVDVPRTHRRPKWQRQSR